MNRNKEYRLKRKNQRKDYIIQDKNLTIKTLYYRNETKRNKIEQLEQKNKQLQNNWNELKKWCKENQYNNAFDSYQVDNYTTYGVILKKIEEMEQGKDE